MKKLIVFLRHNNDIDHITPILYKWIGTKNIATDIIVTSNEEHLIDYRVKYLKEWAISKRRDDIHIHHINDFFRGPFWKWFHPFYAKNPSIDKYPFIQKWIHRNVKHLMSELTKDDDCVVCFDWVNNYFVRRVIEYCHIFDVPVIALPHGDEPYINKLQKDEDTTYPQSIRPYQERGIFDYILVPNQLCAKHYECLPDHKTQVKVFGSPRYCKEWIQIHNSLERTGLDKFNLRITSRSGPPLKVVLFLRNIHWPLNWWELKAVVKIITQFKTITVIKCHARGAQIMSLPFHYDNTIIDTTNSLNPSYLIDWADVVIDVGTSTIWEAVVKNKPILMLDYVCGNKPTISYYMPKTRINCRDDLYENIRMFVDNPTRKTYTQEQRTKFIKEIIGSGNILMKYVNFLEGQFNE